MRDNCVNFWNNLPPNEKCFYAHLNIKKDKNLILFFNQINLLLNWRNNIGVHLEIHKFKAYLTFVSFTHVGVHLEIHLLWIRFTNVGVHFEDNYFETFFTNIGVHLEIHLFWLRFTNISFQLKIYLNKIHKWWYSPRDS